MSVCKSAVWMSSASFLGAYTSSRGSRVSSVGAILVVAEAELVGAKEGLVDIEVA